MELVKILAESGFSSAVLPTAVEKKRRRLDRSQSEGKYVGLQHFFQSPVSKSLVNSCREHSLRQQQS
jgi:hypothetical protein